jgi:hypothetical protein
MNQIARHGKWFSIICALASAVVASVIPSFADDQSPCRVIGDKVNPRFTALWVADDGIWAADDLNHSLILYDRLSGKEKKRIEGLATGLDFPAAVQVDLSFKLPGGKQGGPRTAVESVCTWNNGNRCPRRPARIGRRSHVRHRRRDTVGTCAG